MDASWDGGVSRTILGRCYFVLDLLPSFLIIASRAYHILLGRNPKSSKVWCVHASWDDEVSCTILWSFGF